MAITYPKDFDKDILDLMEIDHARLHNYCITIKCKKFAMACSFYLTEEQAEVLIANEGPISFGIHHGIDVWVNKDECEILTIEKAN